MPALLLYGKKLWVASDDLVIPGALQLVMRLLYLTLVLLLTSVWLPADVSAFDVLNSSSCRHLFSLYIIGVVSMTVFSTLLDLALVYHSSRGTIMDDRPRSAVPYVVYLRHFAILLELALNFWALKAIVIDQRYCTWDKDGLSTTLLVGLSLLELLGMILFILLVFLPKSNCCCFPIDMQNDQEQKDWGCMRLLCTPSVVDESGSSPYNDVIRVLMDILVEYKDLVPSDIVAGMILIRSVHEIDPGPQVHDLVASFSTAETSSLVAGVPISFRSKEDAAMLSDIKHYVKFATAIYGWMFFVFHRRVRGCIDLLCQTCCCCTCIRSRGDLGYTVQADNCCLGNTTAVWSSLQQCNCEAVHLSFMNEVWKTPFMVFLDHDHRSVVVSIRGSMSLKDAITDLTMDMVPIPNFEERENWLAHKGFVHAALYVKQQLDSGEVLRKAFSHIPKGSRSQYRLVITGHSLGASVASVLAFMYREQYPDLVCYSFAPSGATLSYDAHVVSREFVTSIVLGNDLVPRLNLQTLEYLRQEMKEALCTNQVPKWRITMSLLSPCFSPRLDPSILRPIDTGGSSRYFLPGRILHITESKHTTRRFLCSRTKTMYRSRWIDASDLQKVLITARMFADHLPNRILDAVQAI